MAYISVTNTFANGSSADATQVNTNFNDLVQGLQDTSKDISVSAGTFAGAVEFNSTVLTGQAVTYELAPIAFYQSPTVSMVLKDAATITMQAGRYFLNRKVYVLAADLDWTWAAAGQNAGLDTGVEEVSTWYYLYATLVSGNLGVVASKTAPTAKYDTNLSGASYDTNTYLGAFYNGSGGSLDTFVQIGNRFEYLDTIGAVSHTGDTDSTAKTINVPTTATMVFGNLKLDGNTAGTLGQINALSSAASEVRGTTISVAAIPGFNFVSVPIITPQTIYLKLATAANTITFYPVGWLDKWL